MKTIKMALAAIGSIFALKDYTVQKSLVSKKSSKVGRSSIRFISQDRTSKKKRSLRSRSNRRK